MSDPSLFIPAILGTPRQGHQNEYVANFIVEQIGTRDGLATHPISLP
jgi:hypothetical protein